MSAPSATAATTASTAPGGISISTPTGPVGTVVSVTVGDCNSGVVTFTDGGLRVNVPGKSTGNGAAGVAAGTFTGQLTIPSTASAGNALFTASCTPAQQGNVYAAAFKVPQTSSTQPVYDTAFASDGASETPTSNAAAQPAGTTGPGNSPNHGIGVAASPNGGGYWVASSNGGIFSFGSATYYGSLGGTTLAAATSGVSASYDHNGYYLVGSDGGVFAYGDARYYGSLPNSHVTVSNIVGIAPTSDGNGYWLVGSDGGVFAYGDAVYESSCVTANCGTTITGIAGHGTNGYLLAGTNGGAFAFGSAPFYGSEGGRNLAAALVADADTPDGAGYWLTAADGGVFSFGDAPFRGSAAGTSLEAPVNSIAVDSATIGYWLAAADGGVFSYDATYYGSATSYIGCYSNCGSSGSSGGYGSESGGGANLPISSPAGAYTGFDKQSNGDATSTLSCFSGQAGYNTNFVDIATTTNSSSEVSNSLANKLNVSAFQGYFAGSYTGTGTSAGQSIGSKAVSEAQAAGYSHGTIFLDVESTTNNGSAVSDTVVMNYIKGWAQTVGQAGFSPGAYLGAGTPLTQADINDLTSENVLYHLWLSGSSSANVNPALGYEVVQTLPSTTVCSTGIDRDTLRADNANNVATGVLHS